MARETLVDFFRDLGAARGDFLVHDDGYRKRRYPYAAVVSAARGFAARLQQAGCGKGDAVLLWSENRPEWVAAFWGCVLAGVVVVPVDYRSSAAFAARIARIVEARVALVGDEVPTPGSGEAAHPARVAMAWRLSEFDWHDDREPAPVAHAPGDVAQIMFTSGATAEPKGVLITHANILANIVPIEGEVAKYRRLARPFLPLRFLNLLPLSHMFGQAMATFIPPLLPGTVVFMRGYNPADVVRQIRESRVSVLVCVPKMLDLLREHVVRTWPEAGAADATHRHVARRWWRHRRVHGAFGLKFWAFVVGAAPLEPAVEEFWSRLGFLVVQGYGLTETAPIVSLNHPFETRKGSVGKAMPGTEVRVAADGEILVRGGNVTLGYFHAAEETERAFDADGWLHTGDIGKLDEQGRLYVRGRKKEIIVTPEGLNVFPEDIERVLDDQPAVRESAVVAAVRGGEERPHAVLVLEPGAEAEAVVRAANARLADPQRIRSFSVWTGGTLPRTEGTRKVKRSEIRQWVETGQAPPPARNPGESVLDVLARFSAGRSIRPDTTVEELGLSSLDRVEMLVVLESRLGRTIDEAKIAAARTVRDLEALAVEEPAARQPGDAGWRMPSWNRARPARWLRNVSLATWILPAARLVAHVRVEGLEHLRGLDEPVLFASNHQSHLDTPAIFAALPGRWRYHVAVAMAKEFFEAHFHPEEHGLGERSRSGVLYVAASWAFNAFPLPQREAGARRTLRHIGELLGDGWSVLIYPEGERTQTGAIRPFRAGIGMLASRLGAKVVPVRVEGLDRVLHKSWRMPRPGPVRVAFGSPLTLGGDDYARSAAEVEAAVRRL